MTLLSIIEKIFDAVLSEYGVSLALFLAFFVFAYKKFDAYVMNLQKTIKENSERFDTTIKENSERFDKILSKYEQKIDQKDDLLQSNIEEYNRLVKETHEKHGDFKVLINRVLDSNDKVMSEMTPLKEANSILSESAKNIKIATEAFENMIRDAKG